MMIENHRLVNQLTGVTMVGVVKGTYSVVRHSDSVKEFVLDPRKVGMHYKKTQGLDPIRVINVRILHHLSCMRYGKMDNAIKRYQ